MGDVANVAEQAYWSGPSGQKWITHDAFMTTTHTPVTAALLKRSRAGLGMRVLDIGCGTGFGTRAFATQVGAEGHVTGLDIAEPMLAEARRNAARAGGGAMEFVNADAQVHAFEPASYDLVVSQFGVMFFSDPVAAFANIQRAARPGAGMMLAAWGPLEGNPWFSIPKAAAEAELEPLPPAPGAPNPLAFADRARVAGILAAAGWSSVDAEEAQLALTPPGSVDDIVEMSKKVGPAARLLAARGAGTDVEERIAATIRDRLAGYDTEGGFRVPATLNFFSAVAPH